MTVRYGVLTSGRQDWGILRSTCLALKHSPGVELSLLVGGMHCSARFGATRSLIIEAGFAVEAELDWIGNPERPAAAQAGEALRLVGEALLRAPVDALVLVGDRFETAAAAVAATLARVPIVHLHGGEETEGAIDNAFRHAITKMSHLHLVSHDEYARRVIAMGESASTVHVVGAPGLDNLARPDLADRAELERLLGSLTEPIVVVTLHPATLGADPRAEAAAVVEAMQAVPATYVITLPNADPGNAITREILQSAARRQGWRAIDALGERRYWGLLKLASAVLGNSSSALVEAPALALPAVNVGDRQKGRLRAPNVIDVQVDGSAIRAALVQALSREFRERLRGALASRQPENVGGRIAGILASWRPPQPPVKRWAGA